LRRRNPGVIEGPRLVSAREVFREITFVRHMHRLFLELWIGTGRHAS